MQCKRRLVSTRVLLGELNRMTGQRDKKEESRGAGWRTSVSLVLTAIFLQMTLAQ